MGGGGLVVGVCFEPDSGPAQQMFNTFQECRERDFGYFGSSDDKNQVYAPGNAVEKKPDRFAQSSSGAVPFHGIANLFAYHKAAACSLVAIGGNIEPNQRKAQGSPFAPHPLKLVGALQAIDTLHRCVFTTLVFMSLKRGQMRSTVGLLARVSASAPLPLPGKCINRERGANHVSDGHGGRPAAHRLRSISIALSVVVVGELRGHLSFPFEKGSHAYDDGGYALVAMFVSALILFLNVQEHPWLLFLLFPLCLSGRLQTPHEFPMPATA